MGQESRAAVAMAAFDSLSSSVVTERTGDSNAAGGEECAAGTAGVFYGAGAGTGVGVSGAANSCSNSSSQSSAKIHEHDYIGCSSPISVDKPDDRGGGGSGGGGGGAAAMADHPDLSLGLGLGPGNKSMDCGGDRERSLFQDVKLKLPSAGSKRGYSETVEAVDLVKGMKLLPAMFPWSSGNNGGTTTNTGTTGNNVVGPPASNKSWRPAIPDPSRNSTTTTTTFTPFQRKDSSPLNHFSCLNQGEETPSSSGPMVGWPPVQSFRKNTLVAPAQTAKPVPELATPDQGTNGQAAAANSLFVKVYMDGLPIGRKVDLDLNNSYVKLSSALKDMFSGFVSGQPLSKQKSSGDVRSLFDGYETEYVLTYEDKDGDLMLVGDVPWRMFAATVKRLRIMKGSDAIGLGVPRDTEVVSR